MTDVIRALEEGGYAGWYVLEQDTIADRGAAIPTRDVRRSVEFVRGLDSGSRLAGRAAGREVTRSQP